MMNILNALNRFWRTEERKSRKEKLPHPDVEYLDGQHPVVEDGQYTGPVWQNPNVHTKKGSQS